MGRVPGGVMRRTRAKWGRWLLSAWGRVIAVLPATRIGAAGTGFPTHLGSVIAASGCVPGLQLRCLADVGTGEDGELVPAVWHEAAGQPEIAHAAR